ncbi:MULTISPECIES: hypothetical protein [Bacillus cereus group]|uniref:hypothetical protein n=1 Tax=Bacillus cereus group TaxID=86661 RepID=UPI000BF1B2CC|nr:hypothetical protein [Bacillus wiedmannii]PEO37542.1 hypothetical protein CN555_18480 [Bacillus wiedmannii]
MKRKQPNLRVIERVYGNRKREEVFQEVYEHYFGVKVKVTRKTSKELAAEKQVN